MTMYSGTVKPVHGPGPVRLMSEWHGEPSVTLTYLSTSNHGGAHPEDPLLTGVFIKLDAM